jgi:hypothetical protein
VKQIKDGEVKLTKAEAVVSEWHDHMLGRGLSQQAAIDEIEAITPSGGQTWKILADPDFRAHLAT